MKRIGIVAMCLSAGVIGPSIADVTGDRSLGVGVMVLIVGFTWFLFGLDDSP